MKTGPIRTLTGGATAAAAVSFVLLVLIWHLSTPSSGGPIAILFVFTLIYIFFTSLALILTGAWAIVRSRILNGTSMTNRRRYYVSSVLGFLPVLYLTLLSMGGASIWGIVLIILFIAMMLFYVLRRSA